MTVDGGRPEVCVGTVVVAAEHLLLIRRGRGAGVGLWSIPGGRVEFGESLESAALRELLEETGLTAESATYLGHVERVDDTWHFVIHDFLVRFAELPEAPLVAGDDAADARWVHLDALEQHDGVVPGLVPFLREHGVLEP